MSQPPAKSSDLLLLPAGFVVWGSAFIALYGLNGAGCALAWDGMTLGPISGLRLALIVTWIIHVAAVICLVRITALRRGAGKGVLANGSFALSIAALVATLGTGAPALFLSLCR
jgi:hypothetical protein